MLGALLSLPLSNHCEKRDELLFFRELWLLLPLHVLEEPDFEEREEDLEDDLEDEGCCEPTFTARLDRPCSGISKSSAAVETSGLGCAPSSSVT